VFRRIDESSFLNRFLQRISSLLARQRGLPVVFGIVLFVAGFIVQLVNLGLGSPALELLHIVLQNVGILIALVGLLLAEPLGR
jgi:hypothetical protein